MKVSEIIKALSEVDQDLEVLINVRHRVFDIDNLNIITIKDWSERYQIPYNGEPDKKFVELFGNSGNKLGLPRLPRRVNKDTQDD